MDVLIVAFINGASERIFIYFKLLFSNIQFIACILMTVYTYIISVKRR